MQQVLFVLQLRVRKGNCLLKNFCIYQLTTFKASNKFSLTGWNYLGRKLLKGEIRLWFSAASVVFTSVLKSPEAKALYKPFSSSTHQDCFYLLIRVGIGWMLFYHGRQSKLTCFWYSCVTFRSNQPLGHTFPTLYILLSDHSIKGYPSPPKKKNKKNMTLPINDKTYPSFSF